MILNDFLNYELDEEIYLDIIRETLNNLTIHFLVNP